MPGARRLEDHVHAFYEAKFLGPDGVIFDLVDKPWIGNAPAKSEQQSALSAAQN